MDAVHQLSGLINRALSLAFKYDPLSKKKIYSLAKKQVGTQYGGNVIPENFLNENSVCYLAGAGEDVSFDAALVREYGCEVHIFDPTPKAVEHFHKLSEAVKNYQTFYVNNNPSHIYDTTESELERMHFHALGIWDKEETLKFFTPRDPSHASYSATNVQHTNHYIEAKVNSPENIMKMLGHNSIDLLKLDIEGAEVCVVQSMMKNKTDVKVICIGLDVGEPMQMKSTVDLLAQNNYRMIDANPNNNYTFVRGDVMQELKEKSKRIRS